MSVVFGDGVLCIEFNPMADDPPSRLLKARAPPKLPLMMRVDSSRDLAMVFIVFCMCTYMVPTLAMPGRAVCLFVNADVVNLLFK